MAARGEAYDGILSRGEQAQAQGQRQLQVSSKSHIMFVRQVTDEVQVQLLIDGKTVCADLAHIFHDLGGVATDEKGGCQTCIVDHLDE